jgi:hypothetical protein
MKKLLLLLTVIALCGCEKHEETPNYLAGNTFARTTGSPSIVKMEFVSDNTMHIFSTDSYYHTTTYTITETSDTSQVFNFEHETVFPPYFQGTLYFDGVMKDTIQLKTGLGGTSVNVGEYYKQ